MLKQLHEVHPRRTQNDVEFVSRLPLETILS